VIDEHLDALLETARRHHRLLFEGIFYAPGEGDTRFPAAAAPDG
jgi:hypothetical protein